MTNFKRTIASTVQSSIQSPHGPDAILPFLTITHPNLGSPIRVVSDVIDYVVDGETFIGLPFGFVLVSDGDGPPSTQLRVQNVDRKIGQALRRMKTRAGIQVDVRSSADFDLSADPRTVLTTSTPIYVLQHFKLVDVSVGATELVGRVFLKDPTQEPWPGTRATQVRCPGLFR